MQTICAWCTTILATDASRSAAEGVSHGICLSCAEKICAANGITQQERLEQQVAGLVSQCDLLLEMVGDLYDVAVALAPKTGVTIAPAAPVRAWQKGRTA